jgi:hypothetical protein
VRLLRPCPPPQALTGTSARHTDAPQEQPTRDAQGCCPLQPPRKRSLAPQTSLGESGMGAQILSIFGASLLLHQGYILLEGQGLAVQAFDRDRLDEPPWLPDVKALLGGVERARDPLACQASAHIVDLTIDHEIPSGPDRARKGLLMDLHQPAIRIDRLGNSRQRRKRWTGHPRRLVPTGARLVGPLVIVVGQERLGQLRDIREGARPMHL